MQLIDEKQYFAESRKAIELAIEIERGLYNKLSKKDTLDVLKKRKKETTSMEEYERIEELEKQLEKEIKFDQPIPLVPDEYREVIKRNVAIEEKEVNKKLLELRKELKKQLPYLKDILLPLVISIRELEKIKSVPGQIDVILRTNFSEQKGFLSAEYLVKQLNRDGNRKLVDGVKELTRLIESAATKGEGK